MARPIPDSGFAPVSYEQWAAAVAADLGPDALARRLRTTTEDGLVLAALHTPDTAAPAAGVGAAVSALVAQSRRVSGRDGWLVRQRLDAAALTLPALQEELVGGADSIELDLAHVGPLGVPARVAALAAPVWRGDAELALHGVHDPAPVMDALADVEEPGELALGFDPLATWARHGAVGAPVQALDGLQSLRPWIELPARGFLLRASGEPWHDAGATTGWTLAFMVGAALDYVRWLVARGTEPALAARGLEFVVPLGADLAEGIAAVRAVRLVWARVLEELGTTPPRPARVTAVFGRRGLARRDVWANPLRETIAAVAGAVGGADVIQLPPHDLRLHADAAESRRLARNAPLILREEAGLHRVVDPAGGSWYLDTFTGLLAERVWGYLGEVEGEGGMAAALASGFVERRLDEGRARRDEAVRTRRRPLVGVSEFADLTDRELVVTRAAEPYNLRFPLYAEADVFERLRDIADGWARAEGRAPRLFLARLGEPRESAARAGFVRGFASAGGFEAVGPDAVADATDAARAFEASGARVAVLCGADARYAEPAAPAVVRALRDAGARQVLVAGRPGDEADALRSAGVGGWVHQGADIAAALTQLQHAAGVHP